MNRFSRYDPGYRGPRFSRRRAIYTVDCPEKGEKVMFTVCMECPRFGVWDEGDTERCFHEYERLKSQGFYAKTQDEWLEYLEEADPETYQRLIEEKRNRERVLAQMEAERAEVERTKEADPGSRDDEPEPEDQDGPPDEEEEDPFLDEEDDVDDEDDEDEFLDEEDDDEDGWW